MFFVRQLQEIKFAIGQKISRLVFKFFPGKFFPLSKYSPVSSLHYSPGTAILNEIPGFKTYIILGHVTMQLRTHSF